MSAVGSLVFCTDCGNLLESSTGNKNTILTCDCCGAENKGTRNLILVIVTVNSTDQTLLLDTASQTIETRTKEASFPSVLRQKRSVVQTVEKSDYENQAMSKTPCPECGAKEVRFTAVQLRSADEGSTIFYNCTCGNKWTENN
ncbi:putative dna-directed rna polymerase i subunit [Botrytis fragariae]|uniref:DNA-directed RNA polymerase subunit n=1 Tax=Botrytis fragariae TaxID=1964551 RepID=A0A8H6EHG9_9HELO|nr:putative dna-directed rna polymerase i subunit [Botrytis fragariae]KAF5872341.1 putative dna-directed rna polymerase i subunit [Botrytis fragariae]